jgi:hypothetical protein
MFLEERARTDYRWKRLKENEFAVRGESSWKSLSLRMVRRRTIQFTSGRPALRNAGPQRWFENW